MVVGSWWMLREIELAALKREQIQYRACNPVKDQGFGTINLPVSKSDWQALGKRRSHQCICPDELCPVRAVGCLLASGCRRAQGNCCLIHDGQGHPLQKEAMVQRIQAIAQSSGHGNLVIRGHSLRVTGAMRMALAGIPVSVIKVFGRWASEAVMQYLRESVAQGQGALIRKKIQE